jgi:hypothetical protein
MRYACDRFWELTMTNVIAFRTALESITPIDVLEISKKVARFEFIGIAIEVNQWGDYVACYTLKTSSTL